MAKKTDKPPVEPAKAPPPAAPAPDTERAHMDGLTPQQQLFVMYYCGACQFNGAKAARWAGYSEAAAKEIASENLTKPNIQMAVKAELGKRASAHDELVRDVIEEYCKIAFGTLGSVAEFNALLVKVRDGETLPAEAMAIIKKVGMTEAGVTIEMHSKTAALDSLAKILGMLTDDFRVRDDKHENIVERLYKKKLAEREAKEKAGNNE